MEFKDYYKIMGLERNSSQDDIKRAYRRLARRYHPDVSKETDAEAKFKELGEAYEVLKDPEKRAAYDRLGADWKAGQDFRPPPDWDAGFDFSGGGYTAGDATAFSDFFESLFGRGFRTRQSGATGIFHGRGDDHHAKMLVDLEDAWQGATRTISLRIPTQDEKNRLILKQRVLNVRIPKGVKQGQHIRLAGQGAPGRGNGGAGDLYLEVEFKPHPLYQVQGRDLYLELPLAPWEAALGATVKAPTLGGVVDLKIPPGSASGRKLRLKGRGLPGKPPGDLYLVLRIALPAADTDEAKALFRKMEQQLEFNPRSHLKV